MSKIKYKADEITIRIREGNKETGELLIAIVAMTASYFPLRDGLNDNNSITLTMGLVWLLFWGGISLMLLRLLTRKSQWHISLTTGELRLTVCGLRGKRTVKEADQIANYNCVSLLSSMANEPGYVLVLTNSKGKEQSLVFDPNPIVIEELADALVASFGLRKVKAF